MPGCTADLSNEDAGGGTEIDFCIKRGDYNTHKLKYLGSSSDNASIKPLLVCEGDCDSDSDVRPSTFTAIGSLSLISSNAIPNAVIFFCSTCSVQQALCAFSATMAIPSTAVKEGRLRILKLTTAWREQIQVKSRTWDRTPLSNCWRVKEIVTQIVM